MLDVLKKWFTRNKAPPLTQAEEAELRSVFQARYHDLRQLLSSNSQALEAMAELELALAEGRVFGMPTIRAGCTTLFTNVYKLVRHLDGLAPGKYQELFPRLKAIGQETDRLLKPKIARAGPDLVVPMEDVDRSWADRVGGKMANLGEVRNRLGLPTPPGFVVTSEAYARFFEHNDLQDEINRMVQAAELDRMDQLFVLSSRIRQLITSAVLPGELAKAIEEACRSPESRAGWTGTFSIRSSAVAEDSEHASFAGQYASQLNVRTEHVLDSYREVVSSKYSPQAMHYRHMRGLRDEDVPMCVGCLAMLNAVSGGVAYSSNPMDQGDEHVQITSTWGLPQGVVSGDTPADRFVVARSEPFRLVGQTIAAKDFRFDCLDEEGVFRQKTGKEQANEASLSERLVLDLARTALKLEKHYGSPQDVEWALDPEGTIVILQCRPLQQVESITIDPEVPNDREEAIFTGGVAASPGVASGPVFRVMKDSDALRFPAGAVLVVSEPWPRWAALLSRAEAVIAGQGSVAGHLATVAREYGLPALFDVGQAIDALDDERVVTVDAGGRAIYSGRSDSLATQAATRVNLMLGSPVYQTLETVLKNISPLTLLDPDSPEFLPENCKTLHDITRFCHEEAVREVFNFGKEHRYPARASKQLHHKVPLKYWVINLDDGLHQEEEGKYVKLDNISSLPMLAVWEGIWTIPWDGPPGMNAKGFASVMFEATMNPNLGLLAKGSLAEENYFMISRNFVHLQSRYGFHFATVESMVTGRPQEDYATFVFSGGAASQERKNARAAFIGEILERHGFNVKIRKDVLRARLDGTGKEEMLQSLRLLGYLLVHTRQLDMIMSDAGVVRRYREKINRDLKRLSPDARSDAER